MANLFLPISCRPLDYSQQFFRQIISDEQEISRSSFQRRTTFFAPASIPALFFVINQMMQEGRNLQKSSGSLHARHSSHK
jgi:hypothetical protein